MKSLMRFLWEQRFRFVAIGILQARLIKFGARVIRHVRADRFGIAANGIGTPWLLLASASSTFPDGLANGCEPVNHRFMLHPRAWVDGSTFATTGALQPTATARALTPRIADRIVATWRGDP
jgi:choline dehydrogenase-like flavoprotein